jgi:hypothetical protein
MRGTWIIAVLVGAGLVIAGLFAQGMARLAGLPASSPRPVPSAHATTVAAAAPVAIPEGAAQATTPAAAAESAPAHTAPQLTASSPTLQALATAPEHPIETQPAVAPGRVPAPATRRVVAAPAESSVRSLSGAEMRETQCRSLRAWLGELDAMARARPDAATQSWVQGERATTRERQAELRC